MYRYSKIGLLLIVGMCSSIWGQKRELRVEELFVLARQHNEALKLSKIRTRIAQRNQDVVKSARLPELETSLSYSYLGDAVVWDMHFGERTSMPMPHQGVKFGIEVTEMLYQGGGLRNKIEKAVLETELEETYFEKDWEDIKITLIQSYLNLYKLQQQEKVLQQNLHLAQVRLKNIYNLYEEGMVTHNDITRSELQLSRLQLQLLENNNSQSIVNQQLNLALGLENVEIRVPNLEEPSFQLRNGKPWWYFSEQTVPELRIAEKEIETSQAQVRIEKAKLWPSLALFAGNELLRPITTTSPVEDRYLHTYQIGLKLSYDISSQYHAREKIASAREQASLAEQQKKVTSQEFEQRIFAGYTRYQQAVQSKITFEKNVLLAGENYEQVTTKYFNQLALMVDLIDASNAKLEAELKLKNAEAEILYQYYQILRTLGKL